MGRYKRCGFDPWVEKIPWRRKWQPTKVFLPGKSRGQRSVAVYSPWCRKQSDTTEVTYHACKPRGKGSINLQIYTTIKYKSNSEEECMVPSFLSQMGVNTIVMILSLSFSPYHPNETMVTWVRRNPWPFTQLPFHRTGCYRTQDPYSPCCFCQDQAVQLMGP